MCKNWKDTAGVVEEKSSVDNLILAAIENMVGPVLTIFQLGIVSFVIFFTDTIVSRDVQF